MLKTHQKFKIESHNVFTEEINKIAVSANGDKRIQSIDSVKRKSVTKETIKKQNPKWPQIPDHPYRILIIEGSESGKTN